MPDVRGSLAHAARRGAMLASVYLLGAISGYVVAQRDLLPSPRGGAATLSAAPGRDPAGRPAAAPGAAGGGAALGAIGDVAVGPPAADSGGAPTPLPTLEELAALRTALVVPVAGVARTELRDTFHERRDGGARPHHALDVMAPRGTPVVSAAAGRLLKLFTSEDGGRMLYAVDPSGRFVLLYAHLDAYAEGLAEGMALRQGQPLGTVGSTGNAAADAPHLHFAILRTDEPDRWWRGTPVDPRALLAP